MADISGRRAPRLPINGRLAEIAATLMEFVADRVTRRPPSGTAEGVRIALRAEALSIEKAQRELGYAPSPVEPVLRETIAYLLGGVPIRLNGPPAGPGRTLVQHHAPDRRLIRAAHFDLIRAIKSSDMLKITGPLLAFVWSGWTATWPTQLLAIIWIAMDRELGRGIVLVRPDEEARDDVGLAAYRMPILRGSRPFHPWTAQILGEAPLWQFGSPAST